MCIMEGQGVGGHVGDVSVFCVNLLPRWSEMVLTQCDFSCSALNVKVVRNSKQTRTNDRRNRDSHNGSHVCSECQSGSKQARVNGRSNQDLFCKVARCVAFC